VIPGRAIIIAACVAAVGLAACTGSSPRFTPAAAPHMQVGGSYSDREEGMASYYADEFNGRKTSNGEVFDMDSLTAAHRSLPFNSTVKVTNLDNGMSVNVRINDRGPFVEGRIIDLSLAGAKAIGMIGAGTARVSLEVIEFGPDTTKTAK
jgi:rare lipoprotein A (peptidoglycan hydrolase)